MQEFRVTRNGKRVGLGAVVCMCLATAAPAGDLAFEFTNPSFGGNPLYSNHLLGIANAINDHRGPETSQFGADPASALDVSMEEMFVRQLQSRIYSQLTSQIVEAMFGENAQEQGSFQLGTQTITFARGLENIHLTIHDDATGNTTEITVPLLTN